MLRLLINILLFIVIAAVPTDDYGPLQLDWDSCYLAKSDDNSSFLALTALTFKYGYNSEIHGKNLTLRFNFSADIDRAKSWVKRDKIRNSRAFKRLLRHEQVHVDINYLLMRELERKLTTKNYGLNTFKREIKLTADQTQQFYDDMQLQYDLQTNHGTNNIVQHQWETSIGRALADLK